MFLLQLWRFYYCYLLCLAHVLVALFANWAQSIMQLGEVLDLSFVYVFKLTLYLQTTLWQYPRTIKHLYCKICLKRHTFYLSMWTTISTNITLKSDLSFSLQLWDLLMRLKKWCPWLDRNIDLECDQSTEASLYFFCH